MLSLAVLYLLAIIPVAVAWGTVYAVGTAIGSMLAFNFFFLPPLYTLTLQDSRNWFALLVFLVTAVVVSELATRSRRRAEEAEAALRSLREVTEERERLAQEALEAEALRRSDAMKTAMLRAVSHDLRSPLMAILTSAGALAHGELSLDADDRRELAETILGEADRLDRLVRNLLDLSRLQAGAAAPEPATGPSTTRARGARRSRAEKPGRGRPSRRGLAARPRRPPAGRAVRRESRRERAALSPAEEPVRVQVRETGSEVLVRVVDHGPGDPARRGRTDLRAVPARLAARPTRGAGSAWPSRAASPRRTGAGSGSVARGSGSHVRACAAAGACAGRGSRVTGARILVVDDEQQILRALRTSLRGAGYEVDTAETAEAALAAAAMRPPEAVVLDLVLPDGTGTDVAREPAVEQRADHRPLGRRRGAGEGRRARAGADDS